MKNILFTILLLTVFATVFAQKYEYSYDNAGNRIKKTLIILKSAEADNTDNQYIVKEQDNEIIYKIYPNPTKGELKVDIEGIEQIDGFIDIVDVNGKFIYQNLKISYSNTINLNSSPAGIYLMRVIINGKSKEFKIVKE